MREIIEIDENEEMENIIIQYRISMNTFEVLFRNKIIIKDDLNTIEDILL